MRADLIGNRTLPDLLEERAERFKDRPCRIFEGQRRVISRCSWSARASPRPQ